ncbi:microcephalin [Polymixia lowei]
MATGSDCTTILKDVVAFVDVWSSNKTENYSKPFIQQLQEMGAQVSKTFHKQVTHVVFKNGHQATWNKAKKLGVKLVSVLWVDRCMDDAEHVDEELCPAINDERCPALKKRTHRCMQPRDTPDGNPENDRRMRKKLDKMIKDIAPKSPLITDVSPYIIDEENGIVYSPSLKRSDSMAQRLKEMREKRENLSPTASQMVESNPSPEMKPSLGTTPTMLKLFDEQSGDESESSGKMLPHLTHSSDEREERQQHGDPDRKDSEKPWLSPSHSSESLNVASSSIDEDDAVFEDYFSPANHHQRQQGPLLPSLPLETKIQIPFEMGSIKGKRKQRNSGTGNATRISVAPMTRERSGPRTLPLTDTGEFATEAAKQTSTSIPIQLATLGFSGASAAFDQQKNSDVNVRSHSMESRGSEQTVAAGLTETISEGIQSQNEQVHLMGRKTKTMRTLVMTSMPTDKQHTVTQVVGALGGFSIVDRVCESTTHVVSGGHRRTLNILLGIARGCWILSFEWILWCLDQRQWIPEEPYELSDHFPAAAICRLQQHLSAGEHQQDLFQGLPAMFVSQHSQPPTQSLLELIQLCGGTVCKTVRQAGICIGKYNGRRPEGSKILSEQWVLDCITHLKQLSYENYNLE